MALGVLAVFQEAQAPLSLDFPRPPQPELFLVSPPTPEMASLLLLVATKVAAVAVQRLSVPQWSFCDLDLVMVRQPKTSVPPKPSDVQ